MNQFNIVFQEFEQGGNGIFINDKENNFFEGIVTDPQKFEEILEALEDVRGSLHTGVVMQLGDRNAEMTLAANSMGGDELVFSVRFRGKRKTEKGLVSTYFQGTTNLFCSSTPAGGEQFQVL